MASVVASVLAAGVATSATSARTAAHATAAATAVAPLLRRAYARAFAAQRSVVAATTAQHRRPQGNGAQYGQRALDAGFEELPAGYFILFHNSYVIQEVLRRVHML